MPSISVPLKSSTAKWNALQKQRREWWSKENRDRLTPHFRASEFYCHDGSACPTKARPAMVNLCKDFLEPMRAKFGEAHVLSGYRHQEYNASIGGARNSQHIYEESYEAVAADMRFGKGTPTAWATYAKTLRTKNHNGHGGVGFYPKSGFVHIDNRNYKADWSG